MDGPGRNALHTVSSGDTLTGFNGVSDRREGHTAGSVIESAIEARQVAVLLHDPLKHRADLVCRPWRDNPGGEIDMDFEGSTGRASS